MFETCKYSQASSDKDRRSSSSPDLLENIFPGLWFASKYICIYIYMYIYVYITLQIHSVEHSYGLGGESLRETFTICIMHRSLLAV